MRAGFGETQNTELEALKEINANNKKRAVTCPHFDSGYSNICEGCDIYKECERIYSEVWDKIH